MARRPIPMPRKRARKRNAVHTVDAIVEAAGLLLMSDGADALTTNKIAARAGVSIGSLYQYFPNREAVVRELAKRQWTRAAERLADVSAHAERQSLAGVAEACVRVLASPEHGAASLRRALLLEVPRSWIRDTSSEVHAAIVAQVAELLASHGQARSGLDLRAFVLTHAVQGAVDAALLEHPQWFEDEVLLDAFVQDLTRMLVGHA